MTLPNLILRIEEQYLTPEKVRVHYRLARMNFWARNISLIAAAIAAWSVIVQNLDLATYTSATLFAALGMLFIWPAYSFDDSPQSPAEVKGDLLAKILGNVLLSAYLEKAVADVEILQEK